MCDKMAISAYILKIVEKDPFLRLQMRAKEMFSRHQFFSTNKQYVKIKLMQNETNRWSIAFYFKKARVGLQSISKRRADYLYLQLNSYNAGT